MTAEDTGNGMSSVNDSAGKSPDEDSSLSARRARLRGTLAKQVVPPDPYVQEPYKAVAAGQGSSRAKTPPVVQAPATELPDVAKTPYNMPLSGSKRVDDEHNPTPVGTTTFPAVAVSAPRSDEQPERPVDYEEEADYESPDRALPSVTNMPQPQNQVAINPVEPKLQVQALEILSSIDMAMAACAMNLAALQKIAIEQTETLKLVAEGMQQQNLLKSGSTFMV